MDNCLSPLWWAYVAVVLASLVISTYIQEAIQSNGRVSNSVLAERARGLKSGVKYPLEFGNRVQGSSGQFYAQTGFFSARAEGSIRPASALSVAFHGKEGKSYVLELPLSKIEFTKDLIAPETIAISLQGNQKAGAYGLKFRGIVLPGGKRRVEDTAAYRKLAEDGQLGSFLADEDALKSVKIILRPESYNKILG